MLVLASVVMAAAVTGALTLAGKRSAAARQFFVQVGSFALCAAAVRLMLGLLHAWPW
jgi:hypothetical protein